MNRLLATVIRVAAALLARTWRIRILDGHHLDELSASGTPFIYALWHCQILPLLWHHRGTGTALVVSGHRDGGLLAGAANAWGFPVVRGSSTRGGVGAFRAGMRLLSAGRQIAITPDGPRGPACTVKPGVLKLAELTGSPILPVTARAGRAWRLGSWDRFVIPRPFTDVAIQYWPPVHVGPGVCLTRDASDRLASLLNTGSR